MLELHAETTVDARPETVFDYIADPRNHESFQSTLVRVEDVGETAVGKEGRYVTRVAGVVLTGRFTDVAFDRPHRRVYETRGDLPGEVGWTIEPTDGGSHVRLDQRVALPVPGPLTPLAELVARPLLGRELESMLGTLKRLLETGRTNGEERDQ